MTQVLLTVGLLTTILLTGNGRYHTILIQFIQTQRKCQMGSYTLDEVIKRWTRGDITIEQVVGQTLLIVQDIARRVGTLEKLRELDRSEGKPANSAPEE